MMLILENEYKKLEINFASNNEETFISFEVSSKTKDYEDTQKIYLNLSQVIKLKEFIEMFIVKEKK